ncbi:MraY family glycosyltransferase [Pseudomaricurvus sp.]|uniref:MraY family glycosyltransferase n=1 Tax=Pseudomaricurvus sp. TaxID=2004510 RepID=UPI003F6B628F
MTLPTSLIYLLPVCITAVICTYLFTRCYIKYAISKGVIDTPNERSSHTTPTPRGGGLSIVIICLTLILGGMLTQSPLIYGALATHLSTTNLIALLAGGILVAGIGFLDDHSPLSSRIRFSTHFIASLVALALLDPLPSLSLPGLDLTIDGLWLLPAALGLTWLINLYNFMDGIDGIAATEALTVLTGAMIVGLINSHSAFPWQLLFVLSAPILGFLLLNWSPARVFMGDGCSGFLGILLGLLACIYAANTSVNLWCWAILLGVFIVDACWTLATRILTKQQWHQPHRSHCYQILSRKLGTHSKVTLGSAAINLLWLTPMAFAASQFPNYGLLCLLLAYSPLILLCRHQQAGRHN